MVFEDKTGDIEDHIAIDYSGYERYIHTHYPNLCLFSIDREDGQSEEVFNRNYQEDMKLLNKFDIFPYTGLNSPDDVWDSMARSIYNMGFLGRYARMATRFEAGRNYVFSFQEFAHIYPFLRAATGNSAFVKRMNKKPVYASASDFHKSYSEPENTIYKCPLPTRQFPNDSDLKWRSPFNATLVGSNELCLLPGTEWTYLSVDKDVVELKHSFRKAYQDRTKPFDNKRYIYEKYFTCICSTCPGSLRIILDCIHNIVIMAMINPHFSCLEAQKRRVFDITRKLFVMHRGNLDFIDEYYLSIPRRYGLTYVESWIMNGDGRVGSVQFDYTPTFFHFSNSSNLEHTWSSTKNRNWITDSFYTGEHIRKKRRRDDRIGVNETSEDEAKMHGIISWDRSQFRVNQLGGNIYRDEWEYHLNSGLNDRMKDTFRIWRKQYFETSDKFIEMLSLDNVPLHYFKLFYNICGEDGQIHSTKFNRDITFKEILNYYQRYSQRYYTKKAEFLAVLSKRNIMKFPVFNPDRFILPYPLSFHVKNLDCDVGKYKDTPDSDYLLVGSPMKEISNSSLIYIYEESARLLNYESTTRDLPILCPTPQFDKVYSSNPNFFKLLNVLHGMKINLWESKCINDYLPPCLNTKLSNNNFENIIKPIQKELLKSLRFNRSVVTSRPIDESQTLVTKIFYEVDRKVKHTFLIHNRSLAEVGFIRDLLVRRDCGKTSTIVLFTDKSVQYETALPVGLKQKSNMNIFDFSVFGTLNIPTKIKVYLLFSKLIGNFDEEKIINILKVKLPPKKKKDKEDFKLKFDGKIFCNTVGFSRLMVNRLIECMRFLRCHEEKWVGENVKPISFKEIDLTSDSRIISPEKLLQVLNDESGFIGKAFRENVGDIELVEKAVELFFNFDVDDDNEYEELLSTPIRHKFELIDKLVKKL